MVSVRFKPFIPVLKILAVIFILSIGIQSVGAKSAPLPDYNNLYIQTANDPRFDDWGNGTYWFWFPENAGLNTLHITDDYTDSYGQVTRTAEMSGSFYVTDTGGMTYKDDIILLLAVNGSVSDNFSVNLRCNGYQWTPNSTGHTPPVEDEVTYVKECLNADFTKDNFSVYGGNNVKQNWKIFNTSGYPLYYGQDVSDTDNSFKLMFIDLNAGVINSDKLGYSLKNGGSLKVNYELQNLDDCYLTFNVYAYSKMPEYDLRSVDKTVQWTNRLNDESGRSVSGYSVWSLFVPKLTSVSVSPESSVVEPASDLQMTAKGLDQGGNEIAGVVFDWQSDDATVGSVNSDGLFTAVGKGICNVTASNGSITGKSRVVVSPAVSPLYVAGDGSGNYTAISDAVTFAHAGTEIIVRDGIYSESVDIPRTLFIRSENGPDKTVLDLSGLPANTDGFVFNADSVNVSGFNITGASGDGSTGGYAVRFNSASDSILHNNVISGNSDGIYFNSGDNNTVSGNVISCPESADHYALSIKKNSGANKIFRNSFLSGNLKKAGQSSGNLWNTQEIWQYTYSDGSEVYQGSSKVGNFWKGYAGVSGDKPGIGSSAYEIPDVGTDSYPLISPVCNYTFGSSIPAGDTFYVGPDEDFRTIQSAVDAANPGYRVIVRDGTYYESVSIRKNLTVRSENGAGAVTVQSAGYRGFFLNADGILLDGFTVSNVSDESDSGGIFLYNASDCTVTNNSVGGDGVGIVIDGDSDRNLISFNTVGLNSNSKRMFSVKSAECGYNRVCENTFSKGKGPKDEGSGNLYNTTDVVKNYVYNGRQSSSFLGNYWTGADKTDSDGNGIADSPYSDGVTDNYPLVSEFSSYYLNGDYNGDVTEDVPLNPPECTFIGVPGSQSVVVDNSSGHATVSGNSIRLSENGFDIIINTVNPPGGNIGSITGDISSVEIVTSEIRTNFNSTGAAGGSVSVNLTGLSPGSEINSSVNRTVSAGDLSVFSSIVSAGGLNPGDIAFTLRIVKSAGFDGLVNNANVTMRIGSGWVDAHGGPSAVRILRIADSGDGQVLSTTFTGPVNGVYTFYGYSPSGLSLFGLSSVSAPTPSGDTGSSGSSGGGGSSSVGVVFKKGVTAGEEVDFIIDETAISEISVAAKVDIKEIMLTAEKGRVPSGAEKPAGDVYQYISVTLYRADPSEIESATLSFSVDKSAFTGGCDPELTELVYYNADEESWQSLSTVYDGERGSSYEFFADSASLGNFAIVLHKSDASAGEKVPADTVKSGLTESEQSSGDGNSVSEKENKEIPARPSGLLFGGWLSVIGAVCVTALISFAALRRREYENTGRRK